MPLWLLLLLLSLATFRLTRLIVKDTFPPIFWLRWKIQHARSEVHHPVDEEGVNEHGIHYLQPNRGGSVDYWWLGELVSCTWCASAYVSGAAILTTWGLYGLPMPVLCWLGVWAAGAFLCAKSG